jgi:hypothetical protein
MKKVFSWLMSFVPVLVPVHASPMLYSFARPFMRLALPMRRPLDESQKKSAREIGRFALDFTHIVWFNPYRVHPRS